MLNNMSKSSQLLAAEVNILTGLICCNKEVKRGAHNISGSNRIYIQLLLILFDLSEHFYMQLLWVTGSNNNK